MIKPFFDAVLFPTYFPVFMSPFTAYSIWYVNRMSTVARGFNFQTVTTDVTPHCFRFSGQVAMN